ncbi:hypothetical protein [Labilithrix luteola]|uniref:hypothetical protein n=1 Tax=Labilithrix luteola TaxID=1391654 RepID=UPI001475494B|nr:hypothetical protein [Labilithrix luteola]
MSALRGLRAMTASALVALLPACGPTLGKHVAEGDAAHARGDDKAALRAYEKALAEDRLTDHERGEVIDRMAAVEHVGGGIDAVVAYRKLLGDPALSSRDRSVVLEHMARIADGFARSGRHAEAASIHAIVLETGGARVPDRARVVAAVRDETEAAARAQMTRLAASSASLSKFESLANARFDVHRTGGSTMLERDLASAMEATANALWPDVESLERKARLEAAMTLAYALTAPLDPKSPIRAKRNDVTARITARIEATVAEARGHGGALAMRTGWMERVTGRTHELRREALDDLDRKARVKWALEITPACTDASSSLAPAISGGSGALVATRLDVGRCAPDETTTTRHETFVYYVTESYTETKTVYDTVSEYQGQRCTTSYGSSYPSCTSQYGTRQVPRTEYVTKTRQVPRTGVNTITETTYTYAVSGTVRFAFDEKVLLQPFEGQASEVHKVTVGPAGTKEEGGLAADAKAAALARASEGIAAGKVRVDAERARQWLVRASAAETQKRDFDAEDAFAVATRIEGKASPQAKAFFARRLGMDSDPADALAGNSLPAPMTAGLALRGEGNVFARTPLDTATTEERDGSEGYRPKGDFWIGVTYLGSSEALRNGVPAPSRNGLGASFRIGTALFSRAVSPLGPTMFDQLRGEVAFGTRLSPALDDARSPLDSSFLYALGVDYTVLAGYRTPRFGLFGGVDPRARTLGIGDLRTYGLAAPIALRGELRLNGPAVLLLTAWGFSPVGDVDTFGVDAALPLSREGWMVSGAVERSTGPTSVAGQATRERTEDTGVFSFGLGFGKRL